MKKFYLFYLKGINCQLIRGQFLKPSTLSFPIFIQAKFYELLLNSLIEWYNIENSALTFVYSLSTYILLFAFISFHHLLFLLLKEKIYIYI